jgi:hypothetical protein
MTGQEFWTIIAFVSACFLAGVFIGWCVDRAERRRWPRD